MCQTAQQVSSTCTETRSVGWAPVCVFTCEQEVCSLFCPACCNVCTRVDADHTAFCHDTETAAVRNGPTSVGQTSVCVCVCECATLDGHMVM